MKNIIRKILKESDDLSWIQDISDEVPNINQRNKISLTVLLEDYMENNLELFHFLQGEDFISPKEEIDDFDSWKNGAWKGNSVWSDVSYALSFWDIKEYLEYDCNKWEFIENQSEDYDLEYGSFSNRILYKRKSDGRYFALGYSGDVHDGIGQNNEYLYEVFQKQIIVFV
jgi:hypothetical protein